METLRIFPGQIGKILVIITLFVVIQSCKKNSNSTSDTTQRSNDKDSLVSTNKSDSIRSETFSLKDFYDNNDTVLQKKIESIFNKLTEDEKIGQMIITSAGEYGKANSEVVNLIKSRRIGGIILLKGSKESFSESINEFKKVNLESGGLPILFSCDAEPSLINNKISGLPEFTHADKITTVEKSQKTAKDISSILKSIGFSQNVAPVCDVAYNKEIIGDRSFGQNEKDIITLSSAFIRETQSNNIVATAKHFPGHGNVKGDSHKGLVYIDGELKEEEVFKQVIDSGVISVMVGHIAIKNNEQYDTKGLPSTLSQNIVTGLLRGKLGFKGIIVTDAMNMGAVVNIEQPSLNAVKAGCDMILMPTDEMKLVDSVKDAISKDERLRKQVYDSVRKIIRLKICLGLIK